MENAGVVCVERVTGEERSIGFFARGVYIRNGRSVLQLLRNWVEVEDCVAYCMGFEGRREPV